MRDVRRIRDKKVCERLESVLVRLEEAEKLSDLPSVSTLRGHPNYFRIRMGDYRIGIRKENEVVEVVRFLKRGEAYRKFP